MNRFIPDWTQDNITKTYLDNRSEHRENCTCFNCELKKGVEDDEGTDNRNDERE